MPAPVVFKGVYPISDEMGVKPSPVRALPPHIEYYTRVMGFKLAGQTDASAAVQRDGVRLALLVKPEHDPSTSGSCYFDVSDVDALRQEFIAAGGRPSETRLDAHGGKNYRVFFLREDYDNYCFCFGQPA